MNVRETIDALRPWFHNVHLPDGAGGSVQTLPGGPFGDFPKFKWDALAPHLPADLTGRRALDVGCNAGFYTIELARRGADVTAIDVDDHYLKQARFAVDACGVADRVTFESMQVYDLARKGWEGRFDVVIFMGVFYHLRYPLLGLDLVARTLAPGGVMAFQTLTMPGPGAEVDTAGADFQSRDRLGDEAWPKMAFFERGFNGDPTNWWAANPTACTALLRSAGLKVTAEPAHEMYLAAPDPDAYVGVPRFRAAELAAATGTAR